MEQALDHYEFINNQTGNVIAYCTLPADMDDKTRTETLEKKKVELATENKMNMQLIYWQHHDHPIQ